VLGLWIPTARARGGLADGLLERGDAGDRGVLGAAGVDGLLRGLEHVLRRVEVGLAHAEGEHVDPLRAQLENAGVHRERGARRHGAESSSELAGHDVPLARSGRGSESRRREPQVLASTGLSSLAGSSSGFLGASSSSASFKPCLKFLMPCPRPLPMSAMRPAPNRSRATSAMSRISVTPMLPMRVTSI